MGILVRNAIVLAQDEGRRILHGCDVLVEGERIAKVGKGIKERAEFEIDGRGKLLMPGLVNAHAHIAMTLFRGLADDMEFWEAWPGTVWPLERKISAADVRAGTMLGLVEGVRSGTTSFADFYFFPEAVAEAAKKIGARIAIGPDVQDGKTPQAKDAKEALAISERFAKKFAKDGMVRPIAYAHAPYTCCAETIKKVGEIGRKFGLKTHIHAAETRKEVFDLKRKTGKRVMDYLDGIGFVSEGLTAAHSCWLTNSEVKLLGKRKASVAHCPVSNMKLAGGAAAPVPDMVAEGVNVTLGTDGPASNNSLNMLDTMKAAALLHKFARWDPKACPAQQVLDFATLNGAKVLGINAGSIREGKLADFVLMDLKAANLSPAGNLASAIVYAANPSNVKDVVINGKLVLEDGKFAKISEKKIISEAEKAAEKLRA